LVLNSPFDPKHPLATIKAIEELQRLSRTEELKFKSTLILVLFVTNIELSSIVADPDNIGLNLSLVGVGVRVAVIVRVCVGVLVGVLVGVVSITGVLVGVLVGVGVGVANTHSVFSSTPPLLHPLNGGVIELF
jgi:hypothetical protein